MAYGHGVVHDFFYIHRYKKDCKVLRKVFTNKYYHSRILVYSGYEWEKVGDKYVDWRISS